MMAITDKTSTIANGFFTSSLSNQVDAGNETELVREYCLQYLAGGRLANEGPWSDTFAQYVVC